MIKISSTKHIIKKLNNNLKYMIITPLSSENPNIEKIEEELLEQLLLDPDADYSEIIQYYTMMEFETFYNSIDDYTEIGSLNAIFNSIAHFINLITNDDVELYYPSGIIFSYVSSSYINYYSVLFIIYYASMLYIIRRIRHYLENSKEFTKSHIITSLSLIYGLLLHVVYKFRLYLILNNIFVTYDAYKYEVFSDLSSSKVSLVTVYNYNLNVWFMQMEIFFSLNVFSKFLLYSALLAFIYLMTVLFYVAAIISFLDYTKKRKDTIKATNLRDKLLQENLEENHNKKVVKLNPKEITKLKLQHQISELS